MPYDLQEIEKCVRDSVVWIPPCYACAYCELYVHEYAHIQGLALHTPPPENLLKCFTQEYATSGLDPTLKRHLDPTGKYVQISLPIQVSLHWWVV